MKPFGPRLSRSPPAILRKSIEKHFERLLADSLSGDEIRIRAALFLAVIAGFQLMRKVIGSKVLVEADEAVLAKKLVSLFRLLIDVTNSVPCAIKKSDPKGALP